MHQASDAARFDRLPPHSIEAERCLIGSMLLCGEDRETFQLARSLVRRSDFYQTDHQLYFDAILAIADSGRPIDAVIVRDELQKRQLWQQVGADDYLAALLNAVPSAAHGPHYAKIVREKAVGRALIAMVNQVLRDVYTPYQDDDFFIDVAKRLERQAAQLIVSGATDEIVSIGEAAAQLLEAKQSGKVTRLATGFADVDELTGGIPIARFTIIGGKAGMAKSLFARQVSQNNADAGIPVGIVTLEEDAAKIAQNLIANTTGMINNHIAFGRWTSADWRTFIDGVAKLQDLPLYVVDSVERISDIENEITKLAVNRKCRMVIVDHIHLADAESNERREQQVALISKRLKRLAKRLNIAIVGLCQLNRGGDSDHSRKPVLKDLRDSGSLEQDGDLIILLHREDYYRAMRGDTDFDYQLQALVRKNKDGNTAEIPLRFDGDHQRITDWIQETF